MLTRKPEFPYTLVGDYYLPWGNLPDDNLDDILIGIWGQRHSRHIKQHKKVFYTQLLTSGKLNGYLANIDWQAKELFCRLVKQFAAQEGVNEKMKASNQMIWLGRMNNIRHRATEIVFQKKIYYVMPQNYDCPYQG